MIELNDLMEYFRLKAFTLKILSLLLFTVSMLNAASRTPSSQKIFRISVELTSTSDWTSLTIQGEEVILQARIEVIKGRKKKAKFRWDSKSIRLTQPLFYAPNTAVGARFDLLMTGFSKKTTVDFESTKGSLGRVTIDIFNYNETDRAKVYSKNNIFIEPLCFSIKDSKLMKNGPVANWPLESIYPKWVLAFYYPWYQLRDWERPVLLDQPLVPYDSGDLETLKKHISWAESSGIDVFISSWFGRGRKTGENFKKLIRAATGSRLKITIYLETLSNNFSTQRKIIRELKYLLGKYGRHPNFLKYKDKPIVFLYAVSKVATRSGETPVDSWKKIIKKVEHKTGLDVIWIGNSLNSSYLEVFDGLHSYTPSGYYADMSDTISRKSKEVRTFHLLTPESTPKIWASPVIPGFDNRLADKPTYNYIPREEGATYSYCFNVAIASNPDWITITSFNEWWEHTHIEPSYRYYFFYLKMTEKYSKIYPF